MAFINSFTPNITNPLSLSHSSFTSTSPRNRVLTILPTKQCHNKKNTVSMFFSVNLFPVADVVALPQKDSKNAKKRAQEIKQSKEEYEWTREVIGDSPMIKGLPKGEIPSIGWVDGMAKTIFRVLSNSLSLRFSSAREEAAEARSELLYKITGLAGTALQKITTGKLDAPAVNSLTDDISDLFDDVTAEGKGCSFKEYKELFKIYKPDKVAQLNQFLRDDIFGWYRVAGPSPLHIRKVEGPVSDLFPELTDEILNGTPRFGADSLEEMMAEDRLYYVDYKEFDGIPAGNFPDGSPKKGFHIYAPTALLAVPKNLDDRTTLLPIAIRCGQGSSYPMYTSNEAHTDNVTWIAAKCTVQVADGVMHETRYHLGRTHLLLEIFVCGMRRNLAPTHPLLKFLSIHFEGTAFVNFLGSLRLAAPGGTIDVITAPQIETSTKMCTDAIRGSYKFNDWLPDREFETRGMHNAPVKYPYRDDALKLWEAIKEWVGAYVRAYYKSDKDVVDDHELAAWCHEVVDPSYGGVLGFGDTPDGKVTTVDYLVRFIAGLVYIGSVQHAALNFPQGTFMQFVPAMPLAGFAPAPKTPKPFKSIDQYVEEMLPNLGVAQRQLNTAEILAAFQWTTLGQYGRDLNFASDEVDEALKVFNEKLSIIGSEIQQRNAVERQAGLPEYDYLVPKNIPQSTNV